MGDMTREKLIKKVQSQRKMMNFLYRFSKFGKTGSGKEVFLETEAGPVRTLFYGFEDEKIKPVFFGIHGGGFILMNAEADDEMNTAFQKTADCKVVAIDYALAPEYPFPTAVNQVYAVVKEIHDNAQKYGIDPNRMAVGGHSAGGNLTAATCIGAKRSGDFSFKCQVLDFPPLDLATSPFDKPCPRGAIKPKQAATFDACYIDPKNAKDPLCSPVYATREELTNQPPAIVILAGRDSLYGEGAKYAGQLKDAGVEVELHEFLAEKHGFTYYRSKGAPKAIELMANYIKKNL